MRPLDTVRFEGHDPIFGLGLSPDGKRFAVASNQRARVFETATGNPLAPPLTGKDTVFKARFSPDGERVVTAGWDGMVQVWEAASGKPVGAGWQHGGRVWLALFSPDGRRVASACGDGAARVFDVASRWCPSGCRIWPRRLRANGMTVTVGGLLFCLEGSTCSGVWWKRPRRRHSPVNGCVGSWWSGLSLREQTSAGPDASCAQAGPN